MSVAPDGAGNIALPIVSGLSLLVVKSVIKSYDIIRFPVYVVIVHTVHCVHVVSPVYILMIVFITKFVYWLLFITIRNCFQFHHRFSSLSFSHIPSDFRVPR